MHAEWNAIDPTWAWAPWTPTRDEPWNDRRAAHLFRRFGLGADLATLRKAAAEGPQAAIDALLTNDPTFHTPGGDPLSQAILGTDDARRLSAWWLYRMGSTPAAGQEKATLVWHGHFAVNADKVDDPQLTLAYARTLQTHALGRFEPFVQAMSRDPAMLIWLDSTTNRRTHPNENYARELMELFCLGVGAYTERDVQETARAFTGWELRRKVFHFNRLQHDHNPKTVLGRTGPFNGDEVVRIVLQQPAAARFLARKLFRFYVADEPAPSDPLIESLAEHIRAVDFDMGQVLRTLAGSNLFQSPAVLGRKVKSPIDFVMGLLRGLQGTTNVLRLADGMETLGQALFFPPNVKGWDGGRAWINSSTLLARANVVHRLFEAPETRFHGQRGMTMAAESAGIRLGRDTTAEALVDWFERLFLAVPLAGSVRARLIDGYRAATGSEDRKLSEFAVGFCSLPEFHLA